jgi:P-type Cu2+ transporter
MSTQTDVSHFVQHEAKDKNNRLYLMVDGMRCASCAWAIESALNAENNVNARINLSTKRLVVIWKGDAARGNSLVAKVTALGYRFTPFDASAQKNAENSEEKFLLKCIAVSGFASGNIMLFSLALWFSSHEGMGVATRDLMHWVSGLIALPAIIYAGIPYYISAWNVLKRGHTNMDVPISLAVILATAMSMFETFRHGDYVYFDSATMLLFFLLIGRYLDKKARGQARAAAQDLLAMMQGFATIREGSATRSIPIREVMAGMQLVVAAGEKIAADGEVISGISDVDTSLITGETIPQPVQTGTKLFSGTVNITAPIEVKVSAASEHSLLADIIRLMENAEQGQANYVRLADRVARYYTPVVHILALAAFLGWLAAGMAWQPALMIATTVLIITCPCALGLAVPAVQVIASSRLFRQGMLLKSGHALERLAAIDTVVLDKTGTLTLGKPQLANRENINDQDLQLAASLASRSKHPLSQAVANAWQGNILPMSINEEPGKGLSAIYEGKAVRLGRRSWCGDASAASDSALELWMAVEGKAPVRFTFTDMLRSDAKEVVGKLQKKGLHVVLLSGDRMEVVQSVAQELGISDFAAAITPIEKSARIKALSESGHRVLMAGDGLNDAPSLASAYVSISPSSAIDITQNAADIVFQGEKLNAITEAYFTACASTKLVKQNFVLSIAYNIIAVPAAVLGYVTPLIAAIAMSSSSLIVVANAMRLKAMKEGK